jgi:hypothetical protein
VHENEHVLERRQVPVNVPNGKSGHLWLGALSSNWTSTADSGRFSS